MDKRKNTSVRIQEPELLKNREITGVLNALLRNRIGLGLGNKLKTQLLCPFLEIV